MRLNRKINFEAIRLEYRPKGSFHEHPIKILRYSIKNAWMFVFPLLRSVQLFPFSWDNLFNWIRGSWLDILVLLLIFGIGYFRWYSCSYQIHDNSIEAASGVIFRKKTEIAFETISATEEKRSWWMRIIRAVRISFSTASGSGSDSNLNLLLQQKNLSIVRAGVSMLHMHNSIKEIYRPLFWQLLLFSALFSSSFSGAVYAVTIFIQGGRISSDLLQQFQARQILEDTAEKVSLFFRGVPIVCITIGIIIGLLWSFSFVRNLLQYNTFKTYYGSDILSLHMGFPNRTHFHIRCNDIIYRDIRQNLIMKIFGMLSLHVRCPGYGNNTMPVLVPMIHAREESDLPKPLRMQTIDGKPDCIAKSGIQFIWSFVWQPVLLILGIILGNHIGKVIFPSLSDILSFFCIMSVIPCIWLFIVRVVAMFTEKLVMKGDMLYLNFCRITTFHRISVQKEHVVKMSIQQAVWQKPVHMCHLYIVCEGPVTQRFRMISIKEETAREVLKRWESRDGQ